MVKKSAFWKFFVLILIIGGINFVSSMANPAAVYCEEMKNLFDNYSFEIRTDSIGNQYGVCTTPDGVETDEWKFFNGVEGKEYSYCAQVGYETLEGEFGANCVLSSRFRSLSNDLEIDSLSTPSDSIVPVVELMNLKDKWGGLDLQEEDSSKNSEQTFSKNSFESERLSSPLSSEQNFASSSLPDYWDWRSPPNSSIYGSANYSYFDTNHGWMTPVKDQESCGTCWIFAALGVAESRYEIINLKSKLNTDLSEQSVGRGDCSGGWPVTAFNYMQNSGIVDEICYPYTPESTGNLCTESTDRKFFSSNVNLDLPSDTESIKQNLIDNGPLPVAIASPRAASGSSKNVTTNVFSCGDTRLSCNIFTGCPTPIVGVSYIRDHTVVLVGYNDSGQYWILKNSWGATWSDGDAGYFKLGYNKCGIMALGDSYPALITSSNYGPILTLNYPLTNYTKIAPSSSTVFNSSFSTRFNQNASCELYVNNSVANSSFYMINNSNFISEILLDRGNYSWEIKCWEDNFGAIGSLSGYVFADNVGPNIIFNSPLNNSFYNNKTILLNLSADEETSNIFWNNGSENISYKIGYFDFTDGNNTLFVFATDIYGNNASENISFIVDLSYPQINYSTAGNYSRYSNVTFSANISDNFLLKNISLETNISGELLNYSKNISGVQNTSEFNINISSSEIWNFSYRFHATDYAGNLNSTDWMVVQIENSAPVFNVSYNSRSFFIGSNYSINKSLLFSDIDPQVLNVSAVYSLNLNFAEDDNSINISAINDSVRSGWIYIMANDSIGVTYANISVMMLPPTWVDMGSLFGGPETTNISTLSSFLNVPINLSSDYGIISFPLVNLTQEELNISNNIIFTASRIDLNSSALPIFNVPATISVYNITFTNATIHKNGNATACFDCSFVSHNHSSGVFVFGVTGFSYYEITEATYYDGVQNCYDGKCESGIDCGGSSPNGCNYVAPSTTSSGGGGGGGFVKTISKNYSLILTNDVNVSNFSMGVNDSVLVYIDNALHIFNLKNVSNSSILFSLDNIHFFSININATYEIDLNSDNVNDVEIYYQNYSNKKANTYFTYKKTSLIDDSSFDKTDSVFGIYELTFSSYLDYIKNFVLENTFPLVICILLMAIVYFSIFLILENRRLERHLQKRRL